MSAETGRLRSRCAAFAIGAALSITNLFSQSQNPLNSLLKVAIQPSSSDAGGRLEAMITNNSGKSIAAFTLSLRTVSSTGTVKISHLSLDLLSSYAGESRSPRITSKYQHLGPLQNREQIYRIISSATSQTTASVTGIVFDDNTVAGDRSWAQSVFDHHAAAAAELADIMRTLSDAPSSGLRDHIKTWTEQLPQGWKTKAKPAAQSRGSASGVAFARSFVIAKLAEVSRDSISDDDVSSQFNGALSYFSDTSDDMRRHSILAEVKQ